jgi:hypothetical protein
MTHIAYILLISTLVAATLWLFNTIVKPHYRHKLVTLRQEVSKLKEELSALQDHTYDVETLFKPGDPGSPEWWKEQEAKLNEPVYIGSPEFVSKMTGPNHGDLF